MRSRRRRAAETRVPERGNRDSVALSFMVMRTRQNSPNRLSESLVDNEAPHVDKENDGCRIDEPSLLERMSVAASNARSPVTSDTRGALPRHQSVAPGLRRSVGVAAERLTSTPSHHSSSRARRRGLHGSVTPLVAGLHSRLDKLSPVLREDCSHDVVLGPSSLFETPDSDDVFNDDVLTPSSCTKKVHKPDVPALKLCSSPPSVASDYDTARSSRFSFAQHIGASKYQCPEDVRDMASDSATRELKVVVSPLKNAERYSESNSAVLNVSDTSEAISVVMRPLRRRRNPSIRVHAKFPSKSATTRSSGQSSKNVDDGKSLVVDYPVKFLEQDLLKSSFFCEALRCSVVPSPVLTRRQRKVRQSRVPSLDSDASIVIVNKRRKRKDIRSLIPAELLLKPTPLLGSSSEEQNVEGDCKTKENVVTAIDGATKKDALTNEDETKDDSEIKSRLESETCDDVELSFSGDDRNQISEISQNLNLNEIRNNCEEDKEGVQINLSGHGSVPEEQPSPSDSCESTSCIEKSSSHQTCSVVEEAGGETEVSAVADLAAPNVLQVPLKRGKGWRRSLSAQARLSTCALRASSVGGGRQADLRRGNTELSYRRSSARVSRDAGGCERASMAALLGRPSRGSKVPPSPLVEVSFSPVDEGWKKEKKETAEEESQKKNRNGATEGSKSKDAIIEGEGCITEDEENGNKQALKEENDGVVNEERTLDNNISKEKARERILQLCGQEEILQLAECFSEDQLGDCKKIGEGAYGEVFMSDVDGQKKVFKFMPIEGDLKINDEVQKTFAEIHSEIIISMTLSALRAEGEEGGRCSSFVHVLRCWCVRGAYTDHLLSLWDAFHAQKESENDRPDVYGRDQLHIVLEFAPAGQDLECYVFADACQALALFWQVTLGLAVAEEALEFEHRDLHFGNVLVAPTDDISCVYTLDGQQIILPTQGVRATIIDFTMSRLRCADSSVVYSDLSKEPEIFTGSGDYQFDIYRLMRDVLGDDWEKFDPRTNVLWLHYLLDKLITACYYKTKTTSQHRTYISKLQKLKDNVLQYQSARHFVTAYDDDKF